MASLDRELILTGTPEKRFSVARAELSEDYNQTAAEQFFYTYCDQPLSFIMKHSREIFSETYYGYDFYLDLIKRYTYDPRVYAREAVKIRDYIDLAEKNKLPKEQIDKYYSLLELVTEYANSYRNLAYTMDAGARCVHGEELYSYIFDTIYELDKNTEENVDMQRCTDELAEAIFSVKPVYCKFPLAYIFCNKYPGYWGYLVENTRRIMNTKSTTPEMLADMERVQRCIKRMASDHVTCNHLQNMKNSELGYLWINIANKNDSKAIACCDKIVCEAANNVSIPVTPSIDGDAVTQIGLIMEDVEIREGLLCEKYNNLSRRRAIYEAAMEELPDYDSLESTADRLVYENLDDIVNTLEAELAYMEWEDDGTPNSVIARHIMTSKERADEEAKKERAKNSMFNGLVEQNNKKSVDEMSESELCDSIKEDIKLVGNMSPGDSASDEEDLMNTLKDVRTRLSKYTKEAEEKNYGRAKALCEDLEEEIKVLDPKYESVDDEIMKDIETFCEGFREDHEEPKKPRPDVATRIQNKALDRAAKDEERLAKHDEKAQKIKNAANAVAEAPKRVINDLKDFVAKFDKMDDNRRKEFLLKPGFRHKIIKHFKTALKFGMIANIKLAWLPMAALLQHCSNLKDKRIRNELAMELDNEIKICEEKINDANASGDNKSKYELMRIRDKLQAEKTRVRINSKYL